MHRKLVRFRGKSVVFESLKARKNFGEKGVKTIDLKKFRKAPIKIVFDALHGLSTEYVQFSAWDHHTKSPDLK